MKLVFNGKDVVRNEISVKVYNPNSIGFEIFDYYKAQNPDHSKEDSSVFDMNKEQLRQFIGGLLHIQSQINKGGNSNG